MERSKNTRTMDSSSIVYSNFAMNKFLFKYDFSGTSEISNTELLLFALFSSLIINVAYLVLPLIICFVILKHPMQNWGWRALLSAMMIGIFAKTLLKSAGIISGHSSTVPVLQEIGIYLVLVAGRPRQSLYFTEKEPSIKKN